MARKFVLVGPMSVGKGFCMKCLKKNVPESDFIGLGDYFRDLRQRDLLFNRYYGQVMDSGDLLPDEVTIEHTLSLLTAVQKDVVTMDGPLRTPRQIRLMKEKGELDQEDLVCMLNASLSTCKKRHKHRLETKPDGKRLDDNWFHHRIELYQNNRNHIIRTLRKIGTKIVHVNADEDLSYVATEIQTLANHFIHGNMREHKVYLTNYTQRLSVA
jgi:adenylate kinase family enzyme